MKPFLPSLCWTLALIALFFMDDQAGTSLCFFKFIGLEHCWGCGIGRSVHDTLRFDFTSAFRAHPVGIPATIAILWMIIRPFLIKHTPYEPTTDHDAAGHPAR